MIIALAIPAYQQRVHARTALAWTQDCMTALQLGWTPVPFFVDNTGIARARNNVVKLAEDAGARLLLTCDSDSFPIHPAGGLVDMWSVMQEQRSAVVGAAMITRNARRMNCEPSRPGEVYDGEVGTGYMLIDLWKLRDLPRPWFVQQDSPDGLKVQCGEDIYFCRHVKAHGHRVTVNFQIAMGHAEQSVSQSGELVPTAE